MPRQQLLQGFHKGTIEINSTVSVLSKDGITTCFAGGDNYSFHHDGDDESRRFALVQLMLNRHAGPVEIERSALGIPHRTLMNWQRKFQEGGGAASFFRAPARGLGPVLTPQKTIECQGLLAEGMSIAAAAREAGVGESTLRKAVAAGRVERLARGSRGAGAPAADKSQRSRADSQAAAGMGVACTRPDERVAAAVGLLKHAATRFEHNRDVHMGGLLAGLPALCANGLFAGLAGHLRMREGFYSAMHMLAFMGFMALGRIRRPEGLRSEPPGELGKVLGLDRAPEVKTLRRKIGEMAQSSDLAGWMHDCARDWMEDDPDEAGYLYVDGHVRVYTGSKAAPPRRFVSRQRLCLRGTTDYWVNDALGRPFFVVSKTITEGLSTVLLEDILPELLSTVPGQPTQERLALEQLLHRFVVIFDREGASPALFQKLWLQRVAAITYRKNVKDLWPEEAFVETEVESPGGNRTTMRLASRSTTFDSATVSVPVLEVRRLTPDGHQTVIISTLRTAEAEHIAARMFSRWRQENYFAYMMQHYELDGLVQYGAEELPGTLQVANPEHKALEMAIATKRRARIRQQARLGAAPVENEPSAVTARAEMLADLQRIEAEYKDLLQKRRKTPRKIMLADLAEDRRPTALKTPGKKLVDIVKMIAYRAETALVGQLLPHLGKEADARALIRELLVSSADIEPNSEAKTLTVRMHRMSTAARDLAVAGLLAKLTAEEFAHPQTGLRMVYELV